MAKVIQSTQYSRAGWTSFEIGERDKGECPSLGPCFYGTLLDDMVLIVPSGMDILGFCLVLDIFKSQSSMMEQLYTKAIAQGKRGD